MHGRKSPLDDTAVAFRLLGAFSALLSVVEAQSIIAAYKVSRFIELQLSGRTCLTNDTGRNSVCQHSIGDITQHYRTGANHHIAADMHPFPYYRTDTDPRTSPDGDTRRQMRPGAMCTPSPIMHS